MESSGSKRIELLLPVRTIVLLAIAIGLMVAFAAIGSTFLVVFIGIFLAFVFEYPVRFVMEKTRMSRGLAATVTVLGTALAVVALMLLLLVPLVSSVRDFLQDLPELVESLRASDELSSWLGDSGAAGNVQNGAEEISVSVPDAISARARHRRRLLHGLPRRVHDPLHLPVPADRRREPAALAHERAHARRRRALARTSGSA